MMGAVLRCILVGVLFAVAHASLGAQQERTGTLHVIWDTDDADSRAWFLVKDDGSALQIDVPADRADALLELDRTRVRLEGAIISADPQPLLELRSIARIAAPGSEPSTTRDFMTLLCRFPDLPVSFDASAVRVVHGASYPGIQQYYREVSRDPVLMAHSEVAGWFDLPKPHAAYVNGTNLDFGGLMQDCIGAADPVVDFSRFYGINVQTNGPLSVRATPPYDVLSFGGSWSAVLDGVLRGFGATWLSGMHFQNYVAVTHEIGHALGWPHSSGSYGQEYDSRWDVMSSGYMRTEAPWGPLTVHTIAHHKRAAGWIPDGRRIVPTPGATTSFFLARAALPPEHGYLMAEIPLPGDRSYTVEARLHAGHDHPLPAEAIVIHETDGYRAYVVDVDRNGDPNDEGAIWRTGETFLDPAAQVAIRVDSATASGFFVSVLSGNLCVVELSTEPAEAGSTYVETGGALGECGRSVTLRAMPVDGWLFVHWIEDGAVRSTDAEWSLQLAGDSVRNLRAVFVHIAALQARAIAAATGGAPLSLTEAEMLDRRGNKNGAFDLGDLRALLDSTR